MAQSDLLTAHLQDTTSMIGGRNSKKPKKIRTTVLSVLAAIAVGLLISVAQMHQRDKVDALAVKEGAIPASTISAK